MEKGSQVVVAGGAGFIGANLVKRLLESDVTITATYHSKKPVVIDNRVHYVRADLTIREDCRRVVNGSDYVFMCAASTSGAAAIASTPLVHVTPNVVMNARMLEESYLTGVKKFIWISSSVGYPPSGDRPVKEDEFFLDNPPDVYFASGWMKRYTEILGRLYSERLERQMPVVVLRPSNVYGPYDKFDLDRSHVTAAVVRKVVERNNPIEVWGDGNDIRDVIYVDDFVEAMILAAAKVDRYNPINIASGKAYSVREILQTVLEVDGFTSARVVYDKSKPSMIPVRLIDTAKANSVLGFRARTPLREGLARTVSWYREHSTAR